MNKKFRNILIAVVAVLVVCSCIFMFIISPIKPRTGNRKMPEADNQTGEITSGVVVEQRFNNITENITEVAVVFSRAYTLDEATNMYIELLDGNAVLAQTVVNADSVEGSHRTYVKPSSPISGMVGKELTLKIHTDSSAGTGLAVMYDSTDNSSFTFGSNTIKGTICFSVTGQ